jgi:CD63 antigen
LFLRSIFTFQISGIAILAVGAIIQNFYTNYSDFLLGNFFVGPVLLIVVGVIVFVVAFFGCCGAVKENHCMIMTVSLWDLLP